MKTTFLKIILLGIVLSTGSAVWGAEVEQVIYTTGFESSESFTATTSYNNSTIKYQGPGTQQWGIIMGSASTTGPLAGSQSMQMRSYASNTNKGAISTDFNLSKVTKVTFKAKADNTSTTNLNAYYSTDGGTTWSSATSINVSTSSSDYTYNISSTGEFANIRIKIEHPLINIAGRLTIDDVKVYGMVSVTEPTITVTEVTVPSMSVVIGQTDSETLTVSGAALTSNIDITIEGTYANMFTVSPEALTQTGGNASGSVTITYNPTAPGTHIATLKLNSTGATEVTRTLNGSSTMSTPIATAASGISDTGFTANWNAVPGTTSYELTVVNRSVSGTPAGDLFFSEYIEGNSNNKAIEIYNGTGTSVNLSGYTVETYGNGSLTASYTLSLSGTLANNDVYVIYNSSAAATIKDKGDISSDVTFFNGDDAILLKKGSTVIDIIGRIGEDPGSAWTATGGFSTVDKTLVRKSTVNSGISVNPTSGFPTLETEWEVYNIDETTYLGSHNFSLMTVNESHILGSPFTITGETSNFISGLESNKNYFYKVIAKNGSYSTPASNEIEVTTSNTTSFQTTQNKLLLRSKNGNILFNTNGGKVVNIYNSLGQRVTTKISKEGDNSIPVQLKGVVFVKIGSEISKLIVE